MVVGEMPAWAGTTHHTHQYEHVDRCEHQHTHSKEEIEGERHYESALPQLPLPLLHTPIIIKTLLLTSLAGRRTPAVDTQWTHCDQMGLVSC